MNDEIRLLRLADRIVKELDIEIAELPRPVVYYQPMTPKRLRDLQQHYEDCIEDYTKRLPSAGNGGREILLGLIEAAEREIKEIIKVLELLEG